MDGRSKVKSYLRGKDDDQSKVIPKREGWRPKSSTSKRMNQSTHEFVGKKIYVFLLTGGGMNEATHECLGKKSKSSYRRVEG